MPAGCPRCGQGWLEIGPDGGRCPTHGFISRREIDDRRPPASEPPRPEPASKKAIIRRLADVQREEVRWLWKHRVARGKLTILEGDPEVGKSYITLAVATAVTLGRSLPDGEADDSAEVLFLTAEDGLGDTVRPRAEDMGADLTKFHCLTAVANADGVEKHFSLVDDLAVLEEVLQQRNVALIVIDPINAYLGGTVNTNQDAALRAVLTPLGQLAERFNVAVIAIRHLTKGSRDKAIYRGQGSIAYVAAARTVLLVGKNPQDESERVVVCTKNNLAAHPAAIAYEIAEGQFRWKGVSQLTADDLLRPDSGETRTSRDGAKEFLLEALANGARPAKEVEKEAKSFGISIASLRRAREDLTVRSSRIGEAGKKGGGAWLWALPDASWDLDAHGLGDQGEHLNNVITLTPNGVQAGVPVPGFESDEAVSRPVAEVRDLDAHDLDAQGEHLNNLSALIPNSPAKAAANGGEAEEVELVACIGCAAPVPAGSPWCDSCAAKPPLLRLALEHGARELTPGERQP